MACSEVQVWGVVRGRDGCSAEIYSGTSGLRSLLITSDSMRLHRAAYGLRTTACCRANSLPIAAARSKSSLALSFWCASLSIRPLCTKAWHAVRPLPPLKEMARSRSSIAPVERAVSYQQGIDWTAAQAEHSRASHSHADHTLTDHTKNPIQTELEKQTIVSVEFGLAQQMWVPSNKPCRCGTMRFTCRVSL